MPPLSFLEARQRVLTGVPVASLDVERVALAHAAGRVLAQPLTADRDYPPGAKSVRDGFAVRTTDLAGRIRVVGETRAGEAPHAAIQAGEAVEIMTGALMPPGADAVLMVEHAVRDGAWITTDRALHPGENFNGAGCEARAGEVVLAPGTRLHHGGLALAATYGFTHVDVHRRPSVAILSTGDEVVPLDHHPAPYQVRNSNSTSLAAQVARAGGQPHTLSIAPDRYAETRALVEEGLTHDLLLLSGGVSAGKYDLVEQVLQDLGVEIEFDRVRIQPGQPLVFARWRGRPVFGLPGNPASTMVTFEIFARAALDRLAGVAEPPLPFTWARLTREFRHRAGLTRFLPARLAPAGFDLTPLSWSGSGDVPALARANCLLVADAEKEHYAAGEFIATLPY